MSQPDLIQILASFVPTTLVRRLEAEGPLVPSADARRVPAATFFADISGFTALAEKLARRGSAGAERLGEVLNATFGRLIQTIDLHGGEVVKFAGDATLALWPMTRERDLAGCVEAAARCALAAQSTLLAQAAANEERTSMRVGVGAGDVIIATVGGVDGRWEFVVAGDPLTQMGIATSRARPGEVVLAPGASALTTDRIQGTALDDGLYRVERVSHEAERAAMQGPGLDSRCEEVLRAFIPRPVLAHIDAGQADWLAEFRRATVLFAGVRGWEEDRTTALERLHGLTRALQSAVYRYEGAVNQFMVDDKGTTLIAVWGLPLRSYEDNAARAVHTARNIREALHALKLECSIGITTGRVFCGQRGNALRREYAVIGDTVNLAARLMQSADADILCDATTAAAAEGRFSFETLPAIELRGKAKPVTPYRPVAAAARQARTRATIVGRKQEQARLAARLDALSQGEGGLLIIEGEAGIGKSTIAAVGIERGDRLGLPVRVASANAIERSTPYHAWRDLLTRELQLDELDAPARRRKVQLLLDSAGVRRVPLLGGLLGLDLADNDSTSHLTGRARAEATRELLMQLLRSMLDGRASLLVLEDAHWLDSASWALALEVHRRVEPVLMVVVTRPMGEIVVPECRTLVEASGAEWLRLDRLQPDDAVALACHQLNVDALPEKAAQVILDKAEGHPFFTEELAVSLRDSDLIRIDQRSCTLAPGAQLDTFEFPDTVEGVVTSRIDRLQPEEQLTVKVASVIGRDFTVAMLLDVHPVETDRDRLDGQLQTLKREGLTLVESHAAVQNHSFKHALILDTAYNLLPFAQRRELHASVARWHEGDAALDDGTRLTLLAHHWSHAEVQPKAVEYLSRAGEHALNSGAHQEASSFFDGALDRAAKHTDQLGALASDVSQARWRRQLSKARFGTGDLPGSLDHARRSLSGLGIQVPTSKPGWAVVLTRSTVVQIAHLVLPTSWIVSRQSASKRLEESALAAYTLSDRYFYAGQLLPMITSSLLAVNLAERAGTPASVAPTYGMLAFAVGGSRIHRLAHRYFEHAITLAEGAGDLAGLSYSLIAKSVYLMTFGNWEDAERPLERALEAAHQYGDPQEIENIDAMFGMIDLFTGRLQASVDRHVRVLESALGRSNRHHESWGLYGQARAMIPLGRFEEADRLLGQSLELLEGLDERLSTIMCHGMLARTKLELGDLDRAREEADAVARDVRPSLPRNFFLLPGLAGAAEVRLALATRGADSPDRARLEEDVRLANTDLRKLSMFCPVVRPAALLYSARADLLYARFPRARRTLRRSIDAAARMGMEYERALALLDLGRHEADLGEPSAAGHLESAGRLFEKMGCSSELDILRALR